MKKYLQIENNKILGYSDMEPTYSPYDTPYEGDIEFDFGRYTYEWNGGEITETEIPLPEPSEEPQMPTLQEQICAMSAAISEIAAQLPQSPNSRSLTAVSAMQTMIAEAVDISREEVENHEHRKNT
jgi:hypothetical protein